MKLPHLTFQRNQNLRYIYSIRLLRELVNKLVMFFLPIFFFNLHFPVWDRLNLALASLGQQTLNTLQLGLFNIALLYGLERLAVFLSAIPVAKLTIKFGTRHAFIAGHLLYAIFVVLLYLSKINPVWVILAMIVGGIQINYFWNTYHYSLSRNSDQGKMGRNLGSMNFLLNFITMISPALGGLIIVSLGYSVLFLLGLLVILIGMIFAILLDNVKVRDKISWTEFNNWMGEPGFRRLSATFSGSYFNSAMLLLWSLYVFLILGDSGRVGFLYSFSLLAAMLISYAVGPFLDKNRENKKPFFVSGGLLSVIWLLRNFVVGVWSIAIVNTLDSIAASFHWLFFDRVWIVRGKGREGLSYFTYREMITSAAALFFWIVVFFLFYFFCRAWQSLFVLAAIGVLLTLLVQEHQDPKD